MRTLLRRLIARTAAPHPEPSASDDRIPPFPMIDGGALACPDLAASLVILAVCYRRTAHARHD
ncbi:MULTISPECIES: hypothetical protein [unclassified Methylobacterium]|jgi:hypothetical protein|uniref:hypothetical protein n=1 Tax=unclassified Methylobacterium TaxID=2615210 RepID=UPI00135550DA|nr:hypothetical protein [Methylobacterium sp. 2A]MWV20900.1 hypothetical protein [Methylobacterium sp. 2A]